jgi:hypothetical protein
VTAALVLAALLALAAVVAVALPFLREPEVHAEDDRLASADPAEQRRLQLLEERDRALAALSELELDHRTGKVSDEDYEALLGPLRARAAAALRALQPLGKALPPAVPEAPDEHISRAVAAVLPEASRARG